MTDLNAVKEKQQKTWASGDFSVVAMNTVLPGELLCETVDVRAGNKVLDVATGSGNAALSAARRACKVDAIDYVPALIEKGKERAALEHLPVTFKVGDCENIPYEAETFDVVLSMFGSMFAPDQEKSASELIRVCKKGGKIGLTCWTPDGFWGKMFKLNKKYMPHPEGLRSPVEWGTEERLKELFGMTPIINKQTALFRYESADHFIEFFRQYFGPILKMFESLDEEKQKELTEDIKTNLEEHNTATDGTLLIPATYIEAVFTK